MKPPVLGEPVPGLPLYDPEKTRAAELTGHDAMDAELRSLGYRVRPRELVNPNDLEDQNERANIRYLESIPTPCCESGTTFFLLSRHLVCLGCSKRYTLDSHLNLVRILPVPVQGEER